MGRADGTPLSEREFIVSIMAGLAATVQVGDLERSEQMLTIIPAGPGRRRGWRADRRRHRAHRVGGPAPPAVGRRRRRRRRAASRWPTRLQPEIDPNLHVGARAGARRRRLDRRGAGRRRRRSTPTIGPPTSTGITAGIARGLALSRRGDVAASAAAFDQVRAAADATEDRVSQALVRLADATAATARGDADAARRASPRPSDAWRSSGSATRAGARRSPSPSASPRSGARAQDGLLDHPEVGLLGVPAVGELRLGVLVGDRRHDDHVLALLPVRRAWRPCAWR